MVYPTIQVQHIDNMSQPPTNQKRTPTRRDLEANFLAGMVGTLASQIIVRPITVTILGDSHCSEHRLGQFLRHMSGPTNIFRIRIISAAGLTVSELLQDTGRGYHLLQRLYQHSPDICIIAVGGNDVRRHFTLKSNGHELGRHLVELGTLMQERNIMPVWLEIPPRQRCGMALSVYQQFCRQANQVVRGRGNDLRSIQLPNTDLIRFFQDGVHFRLAGYKIIASAIRNHLNRLYGAFTSILSRSTSQAQATAHTASNPSNDPTLAGGSSQTAHKHESNPERNMRPASRSQKMKAVRQKRSRPFLNRPPSNYQALPGPPSRGTPSDDLPIPGPSLGTPSDCLGDPGPQSIGPRSGPSPSDSLEIPDPSLGTPSDCLGDPGPPNIRPQSRASSSDGLGSPWQSRDRPVVLPNGIRMGPEVATVAPFHVVPPAPDPPNRPITYTNVFLEEPVTVTVRGVPTSSSSEDSS